MNLFSKEFQNAKEIKLVKRDDGYYSVSFNTNVYDTTGENIVNVIEITFDKVKFNLGSMEVMVDDGKYGNLVTIE